MYTCTHVCTYLCVRILHIYVYIFLHTQMMKQNEHLSLYNYSCTHMISDFYIFIFGGVFLSMCIRKYVVSICIRMCISICIENKLSCAYIYILVYTYICAYVFTQTHIHTCNSIPYLWAQHIHFELTGPKRCNTVTRLCNFFCNYTSICIYIHLRTYICTKI